MGRRAWMMVLIAGAAGWGGPGEEPGQMDVFSAAEGMKIKMLSPLGVVPTDTTNKYGDSADAAKLGQRLYFDKAQSGALAVGTDTDPHALGMKGDKGKVNCV